MGYSAPMLRIGTLILVISSIWISPLSSERQVPTFRTRAWIRFALPFAGCRPSIKQGNYLKSPDFVRLAAHLPENWTWQSQDIRKTHIFITTEKMYMAILANIMKQFNWTRKIYNLIRAATFHMLYLAYAMKQSLIVIKQFSWIFKIYMIIRVV